MHVHHADDALVVVEKPAGLLSVPGLGDRGRDHLLGRVQQRYPDAQVAHRLDLATSGLMVFARGTPVRRALGMAFERREVHKRYIAIVHGLPEAEGGEIDAPLAADWPNRPRQVVDAANGRPSLTRWRVLGRDAAGGTARLELEPVTGRSHQLRVHLQHLGHPIVGDALYGPDARPTRASAGEGDGGDAARRAGDDGRASVAEAGPPTARRLLLHACVLALRHPVSGAWCEWRSEPPF